MSLVAALNLAYSSIVNKPFHFKWPQDITERHINNFVGPLKI